jgi:hypothetical protein
VSSKPTNAPLADLIRALLPNEQAETTRTLVPFIFLIAAGWLFVLLYSLQLRGTGHFSTLLSLTTMEAGAALLIGGLTGFLFGIPRTLVQDSTGSDVVFYRSNTNLEQVSDWLTKILLGVGLTQIPQIPRIVRHLATYLSTDLGIKPTGATVFLFVLLVYYSTCGFFSGFLWSRLALPRQFYNADNIQVVVQNSVNITIQERGEKDAQAIILASRQLNPKFKVKKDELLRVIEEASPEARTNIFIRAQEVRSASWKDDKSKMERTIPIFKALVAADTQEKFHRNRGELGIALKDQEEPDWSEAEKHLSKAIEIRNRRPWKESEAYTTYYEFNRAICRIEQQKASGRSATPQDKEDIRKDLRVALLGQTLEVGKERILDEWLKENSLTYELLRSDKKLSG